MKEVLVKSFSAIAITALLNLTFYLFLNRSNGEIILIGNFLTAFAASSIIIGFVLSYLSQNSSNLLFLIANGLLFVFNGFVLLACSIMLLWVTAYEGIFILIYPYVVNGWWVFYRSTKVININPKEANTVYSDETLLDDNFGQL